jgi:Nucleotidyl transferase AbiEii toxin, Type IV TA system
MSDFRLAWHQLVVDLLSVMDRKFLTTSSCYFGGGTRIVLELDEYRESRDIDFMCSSRDGYRKIRNTITQNSLGGIFNGSYRLMREVRADMYGIRTYLEYENQPIKFEIISEGRIDLAGARIKRLPVDVLDHTTTFAEKFLANADRGRDSSTRSRDLIDLAFMASNWEEDYLRSGFTIAESVYGASVFEELKYALGLFADSAYRSRCIKDLAVSDRRGLNKGIRILEKLDRGRA